MRVRLGAMLRPSSSSSSSPKGQHLSPLPQKGKKKKKKRNFTKTRTTRASLQELQQGEEKIVVAVLKYFSAGGIGCFASHCLSVPLDVIKTKVQLNPELNSNMSAAELARKIVKDEGAMTLTRGLGATFFGYLIQGGCKYGGFETLKRYYFHGGGNIAQLVLAAMVAESVGSFALVPFERARVNIVGVRRTRGRRVCPQRLAKNLTRF